MVLAMTLCLSRSSVETTGRIRLVFGIASTLRYCDVREFMYLQKIRVLPSGTLFQTLNVEKFRHGTSTATDVVNLVRLTTVATLS